MGPGANLSYAEFKSQAQPIHFSYINFRKPASLYNNSIGRDQST